MRKFLNFCAFSILASSFSALFVAAQPKTKLTSAPTLGKIRIERTTKFDGNVEFPRVSGWTLGAKEFYGDPRLGYSVLYRSPEGGTVTVYVYNGGRTTIPNSLAGVVAEEMNRAKNDIQILVARGSYDNARLLKSETINFGGPNGRVKSLYAGYDLGIRGNQLLSEIYLFPYQNYFVKIRATRPKAFAKSEVFADLLAELDMLFLR